MTAKSLCLTVFIEKFAVALTAIIFSIISFSLFSCGGCGGCGGGGSSSSNGNGSSHSATLTYDAPTTNVDGTQLTDLSGYKVYYGTSPRNYTILIDVGSALCQNIGGKTECTYTVESLISGTYYFAVTAYDTEGDMSVYSNEVSKTID